MQARSATWAIHGQRLLGPEFTLVRNPHYWQKGLPKIYVLHFLAYASNPSASLASTEGLIDMSFVYMPNYQTGFLDKNPKQNHVAIYPIGNIYLCPNLTVAPFNKTVVRQAVSEAISPTGNRQ